MADVTDVNDEIGVENFFEGRTEGCDQLGRQVRDKAHGVGEDDLFTAWQIKATHGRIERRKEHVFGKYLRTGNTIE